MGLKCIFQEMMSDVCCRSSGNSQRGWHCLRAGGLCPGCHTDAASGSHGCVGNYMLEFTQCLKYLQNLHKIWHLKEKLLNTQKAMKTELHKCVISRVNIVFGRISILSNFLQSDHQRFNDRL